MKDKRRKTDDPCLDPEHNPPTHLYIPPGKTHVHICPTCGTTITVTTPLIHWRKYDNE